MTTNDSDDSKFGDRSYRDGSILQELYVSREMTIPEIAGHFGVADSTIHRWIERNGIETRKRGHREPYVPFDIDGQGYERWKDKNLGDDTIIRVHQLLAVAAGAQPADVFGGGVHVHHRNGIPWDNRPDNVTVLSAADHASEHNAGSDNEQSKLTESQVREIKARLRAGESDGAIAEDYPVVPDTIKNIRIGRAWSHVE